MRLNYAFCLVYNDKKLIDKCDLTLKIKESSNL
jgi:hypothetical protein